MRKIHVITQKEAVNEDKLYGCTTAVIDVFLATSTISFLLEQNYETVYAVKDSDSAIELARGLSGEVLLLGETKGESIEGFQYPDPCLIKPSAGGVQAVICSTNGTRAIEKAINSKRMYISSLVNGHLIAEQIHQEQDSSSIVLICSGNDDRFSMEDFIGAGQIINHLMKKGNYVLTDASKMAKSAYDHELAEDFVNLHDCETADLLRTFDFEESIYLILRNFEKVNAIPIFEGGKIIDASKREGYVPSGHKEVRG